MTDAMENVADGVLGAAVPGPMAPTGVASSVAGGPEPVHNGEDLTLENYASNTGSQASQQDLKVATSPVSAVTRVLLFAGSCSVNLLLPFVNGLMLGFGELVAHELCWKFQWFSRRNRGYKIYPESRRAQGQRDAQIQKASFL
ncbi:LAMI_0A06744g1_1 [Lachancea mirantina]|uniref:LAMI_0A06744g1_1 n=1 Tax=Lachancea mirantina TaxID=1230905 RepID=A0A1G4IQG9_9SACH|nr:LAMI_0A06744g1_1 [Lachancea mirantina]